MTTSPVVTITEELVAELECKASRKKAEGFILVHNIECDALLALLAERAAMQSQIKAGIVTQDNLELYRKDADRLNKLDSLCEAYGFEGIHEGNRWIIDGPYRDIRTAIDAIPDDQAMQEQKP